MLPLQKISVPCTTSNFYLMVFEDISKKEYL